MSKVTLYHGSPRMIQEPLYGYGKTNNDYGRGFYCTENIELAKEWSCSLDSDGYANEYEIETDTLQILNLLDEKYTILHWLALLIKNREPRLTTPLMKLGNDWILQNYLLNTEGSDVIVGYRADDSYFSFARSFLNNEISLEQLSYSMRLGKLGEQFVLVSEKAFEKIRFLRALEVDQNDYYPRRVERDINAKNAYQANLEEESLSGVYIRDLVRDGVKSNDPRLQ